MIIYFDTSALVKLYVEETGSNRIRDITHRASVISTSKIAYPEARSSFARKRKEGGFSQNALRKIVEQLNRDWESYLLIEITDGLVRAAGDLAEKYLLRGFDSIHLASAVQLRNKIRSEISFSSTDLKLNQSAQKEGLSVVS